MNKAANARNVIQDHICYLRLPRMNYAKHANLIFQYVLEVVRSIHFLDIGEALFTLTIFYLVETNMLVCKNLNKNNFRG